MMVSALYIAWISSWIATLATIPSVLLRREGRPLAALSWILAMLAAPPVGLACWWLFGRTRLQRKLGRRLQATRKIARKMAVTKPALETSPPSLGIISGDNLPPPFRAAAFPPSGGNCAELKPSPRAAFAAWEALIRKAEDHLHLIFFVWADDEVGRRFRSLLIDKARQGVEVRIIIDGVGSAWLPEGFFRELKLCGGQIRWFMQPRRYWRSGFMNLRNHRKLLIADGKRAFLGGINLHAECLDWCDVSVGLEGPAVDQLQEVFAEDWYYCADEALLGERYFGKWQYADATDPVVTRDVSCATIDSGPDQAQNAIREALFLTINACRDRLWIMTPYLIPDSAILLALRTAVYRGVDVRIIAPRDNDVRIARRAARAFYPELIASGIKIYEYHGMLHAKVALFDDELSVISSANFDPRSFRLNFEISSFLGSSVLNDELTLFFEDVLAEARQVSPADVEGRSRGARIVDAAAHLLSPLL